MAFLGLSKNDKSKLQYEVVSSDTRLKLTRLIRSLSSHSNNELQTLIQNRFINIARNVLHLPQYVLEPDDWDNYSLSEYAWHIGELELVMKRPNTAQLIEILADCIQCNLLDHTTINEILENDGVAIWFDRPNYEGDVIVCIIPTEEIEETENDDEHPNIRKLVDRMENALGDKDYPAVLHSSASIFETLAKDVVNLPSVQNETLASFFDRYRKDSELPSAVLDYILSIYKRRNTEPLAGHGSTTEPSITSQEAIILCEMTKTFVRIERQLSMPQIKSEQQTPRDSKRKKT